MDIRKQIHEFIEMYVDTAEPKKLCSSIQDLVEELAESKVKNITVTHCCKSDSDLLLFSPEEIAKVINENTVLNGEHIKTYFLKK